MLTADDLEREALAALAPLGRTLSAAEWRNVDQAVGLESVRIRDLATGETRKMTPAEMSTIRALYRSSK